MRDRHRSRSRRPFWACAGIFRGAVAGQLNGAAVYGLVRACTSVCVRSMERHYTPYLIAINTHLQNCCTILIGAIGSVIQIPCLGGECTVQILKPSPNLIGGGSWPDRGTPWIRLKYASLASSCSLQSISLPVTYKTVVDERLWS